MEASVCTPKATKTSVFQIKRGILFPIVQCWTAPVSVSCLGPAQSSSGELSQGHRQSACAVWPVVQSSVAIHCLSPPQIKPDLVAL